MNDGGDYMGDAFCYYLDMPCTVRGVSVSNSDGTITIYINNRLSYEQQKLAYQHEINHIGNDDFNNCNDINKIEYKNHNGEGYVL